MTATKTDAKVIQLKPHQSTHTKSDTIEVTKDIIAGWKAPPFQRPLRVNERVRTLAEVIKKDDGVVPGVITLGILGRDTYLLDGQHRIYAFLLSEISSGYTDIRIHHFEDMAAMGEEFVNLNSRLVNLRSDDILRGLEESLPTLRAIRQKCSFVGYDMIRRGERSPILSMSGLLRCWAASASETPAYVGSVSAVVLAKALTKDEVESLISVLSVLESAWGRDDGYARLWGGLNLTLSFWLWRRLVVTQYSPKSARLTKDLFKKCMMSVSTSSDYLDWLVGRRVSDRDRSPAFSKIKNLIAKRLELETGKRPLLPQPAWGKSH